MASVLQEQAEIFAANRAVGRVELSVGAMGGRTRRRRLHENGSLRVRFPNATAGPLEAIIINTAGGMTGGDRFAVDVALGPDAELVAGTAAAEKIYRSTGPEAEVNINLSVSEGGRLAWLPQETILFDQARLSRRFDVDLAAGASLIMAEAVVFGRSAMGEGVAQGRLADLWRVRRDGRLIYADGVRLDGAIEAKLAAPAVTAGGVAIATVLVTPADDTVVAAVRACEGRFTGAVGISSWNGIAVARFCADDAASLRRDLVVVLAALGTPVPRLWLA
ncbi:MAG: urease accessory protein UreD [Pseudolabrys sp.]